MLKTDEGPGAISNIDCLDLEIPLSEVYATVDLPELLEEMGTESSIN